VIVVGGGPAGLAAAIAAATGGLDVLVLERRALPTDKACGEGLLPAGVRALAALGALQLVDPSASGPIRRIRWIDRGLAAEATLRSPGGLGIRRTALSAALLARALACGVEVRVGVNVRSHRRLPREVEVDVDGALERGRLLVAADGLASPVRRREGLDVPSTGPPRFGLRRHFVRAPWADAVEVHFGDGVEAYVTPAGPERVGVAFLCEASARAPHAALLARFPDLADRLAGAPYDSTTAGAGPMARGARARAADRLVLVGDAAGYEDAITGEGLSLAFAGAVALGQGLPAALAQGASREAFQRWERGEAKRFAVYANAARLVLGLARRAGPRRATLAFLAQHPYLFRLAVGAVVG
jgi:2-polyprenyl-6-methoxyphenol hydroxylase-like FAD-dependent oxidoreductase